MTCEEARENGLAASYVAGVLTPDEMEAFEAHYFGCDACFADVEAMRLTREELKRPRRKAAAVGGNTGWIVGLAAAAMIGAWFLWPAPETTTPPVAKIDRKAQLIALAKIERPAYTPVLQRGAEDAAFDRAMALYAKNDCAAALPLLATIKGERARFFGGACSLEIGDTPSGIAALENVGGLYEEEAKFLVANAHLKAGDEKRARDVLQALIALQGDWAGKARELLAKVEALR